MIVGAAEIPAPLVVGLLMRTRLSINAIFIIVSIFIVIIILTIIITNVIIVAIFLGRDHWQDPVMSLLTG